MTDLDTIKNMFEKAGIVFLRQPSGHHSSCTELRMTAKSGEYNEGYEGFEATLTFRPDGSLKAIGACE